MSSADLTSVEAGIAMGCSPQTWTTPETEPILDQFCVPPSFESCLRCRIWGGICNSRLSGPVAAPTVGIDASDGMNSRFIDNFHEPGKRRTISWHFQSRH